MSSNGIHNFPDDLPSNSRRRFIKSLIGGATAAAIAPSCGISVSDRESQERTPTPSLQEAVASIGEMETGDEEFWGAVKRQFAIRDGLIMLNAANLCPSPISIEERVFELTKDVDADPSHTNRAKFSMLREEAREPSRNISGPIPTRSRSFVIRAKGTTLSSVDWSWATPMKFSYGTRTIRRPTSLGMSGQRGMDIRSSAWRHRRILRALRNWLKFSRMRSGRGRKSWPFRMCRMFRE